MGLFTTSTGPARARKRFLVPLAILIAMSLAADRPPAAAPGPVAGEGASTPGAAAAFERVVRSDLERLVFALEAPEPVWSEHALGDGAVVMYGIDIPGFSRGGRPGSPELPRRGGWIVVPPGKRPVLRAVREEWRPLASRRLLVAPTPIVIPDPDGGEPWVGSELVLPGEQPRRGAAIELPPEPAPRSAGDGGAVSLGEPDWWRGRRIVSYLISPVQADAEGRALRALAAGEWEVRFVPDERVSRAPANGKRTARGDDRFGAGFLNGEALSAWPPEAAALPEAPKSSAAPLVNPSARAQLLAPEVRIPVSRTRLHRVAAAELRTRGLLPATPIQEGEIRLYQRYWVEELDQVGPQPWVEVEVPIHMVGEGDLFDGDDYFLFWGLRPRDDLAFTADLGEGPVAIPGREDPQEAWSGDNVYWLAAAAAPVGETWARMERRTLAPASGPAATSFRRVEYIEEDFAYEGTVDHIGQDRNHWNDRRATEIAINVPLSPADPAGAAAELRVGIAGSLIATFSRPLAVSAVVGASEQLLGTVQPMSLLEYLLTVDLPPDWLLGAELPIRIRRADVPGDFVWGHFDWLELSYDALYRASGGKLRFAAGEVPGDRDLLVGGFAGAGLGMVEISDQRSPVWVDLDAANLVAEGSGIAISAHVVAAGGRSFYAEDGMLAGGTSAVSYSRCSVVTGAPPLEGAPLAIDLLVVAHPQFLAAAGRWVEHRRQRSGGELSIHVVTIDDVYDAYSGGLVSPWALKRVAAEAIRSRGAWALQIVGDANENVRGLGVAGPAGICWIPTHLHVQNAGFNLSPEVLASDDWFASSTGDGYPDTAALPPQMLVGRFPCNTTAELDAMVDKVLVHEAGPTGQEWRRRAVFWADDAWSYGYGGALTATSYNLSEERFETSENLMATWWEARADIGLAARRFFLSSYLEPLSPPHDQTRRVVDFKNYAEALALPPLLAMLSDGALVVHYQGHANAELLSHEDMFKDRTGRRDVGSLANNGRPWVFFGVGCHIADWAQNTGLGGGIIAEPSLGEKMLARAGAGAAAVYASSGYEYLDANVRLSEGLLDVWMHSPPLQRADGEPVRSRWVLGELLWKGEAELLAEDEWGARTMTAQYCLLGDALMTLDAGPPAVAARALDAGGEPLSGTVELAALDAGNQRRLEIAAADEAGIDRIEISGSDGADLTAAATLTGGGAAGHQQQTWEVLLPVRPLDHEVTVKVWDTARPLTTDAPWELRVRLPLSAAFRLDGQPVGPDQIPLMDEVPVALGMEVRTAAWLAEDWTTELTAEGLALSQVLVQRLDEHRLDLTFTATPLVGASEHKLRLVIDGQATEWALGESEEAPGHDVQVQAFPNPMAGQTRFVVSVEAPQAVSGRIIVFSLAGRPVATVPVRAEDAEPDATTPGSVVSWDGRDGRGGELANGVYLYRAELEGPAGSLTSPIQRLVIMR